MATVRSIRLIELQWWFLSMARTLRTSTVNNYLSLQQALEFLQQLTHPTKPALRTSHAVSPLPNTRGYIIWYQSKMHTTVRAVIAQLLQLFHGIQSSFSLTFPSPSSSQLGSVFPLRTIYQSNFNVSSEYQAKPWLSCKTQGHQPKYMPVLMKGTYTNETRVAPPSPSMPPHASKRPEAFMQAIDEWFDFQNWLKVLGLKHHPSNQNEPESHGVSQINLMQNMSKVRLPKKTTKNLQAKLQHASGPLLPLIEQLLHLGDCNAAMHSHPTTNLKPKSQDNISLWANSYLSKCQKLDHIDKVSMQLGTCGRRAMTSNNPIQGILAEHQSSTIWQHAQPSSHPQAIK